MDVTQEFRPGPYENNAVVQDTLAANEGHPDCLGTHPLETIHSVLLCAEVSRQLWGISGHVTRRRIVSSEESRFSGGFVPCIANPRHSSYTSPKLR